MIWRILFVAGAVLMMSGGPQHPGGTMLQMLQDPKWFISHALITAGFIALTAALVVMRREMAGAPRVAKAMRFALPVTILQTIEYVMHTIASVDAANLAAGNSTPVLTTHLTMALVVYPLWAAGMIPLVIAGMRDRAFGSKWIGWLGLAGLVAHGLSAPLAAGLGIAGARILFPMLMFFSLWMALAAIWPNAPASAARRPPADRATDPLRS